MESLSERTLLYIYERVDFVGVDIAYILQFFFLWLFSYINIYILVSIPTCDNLFVDQTN